MKIETLVAAMNQKNLKKFDEMNIQTDVIIANQGENYGYIEEYIKGCKVQMVSTSTKGVGLNRNIALNLAEGDICIIADDDIVYNDGYNKMVEKAFNTIPDADMIIFNITTIGRDGGRRKNTKIKRIRKYNFMNYGAARIAFRRDSVLRKNIWFSHLFGGGAMYSSGEDTFFLKESLQKGLKIYSYPEFLGAVRQETSTWFTGYNEKYFFDKGALMQALFPVLKYIFNTVYFPLKFRRLADVPFNKIRKLMVQGSCAFKKGVEYRAAD